MDPHKSEIFGSVPALLNSTVNSKLASPPSKQSEAMNTSCKWQQDFYENDMYLPESAESDILPSGSEPAVLNSTVNSKMSTSPSKQSAEGMNTISEWQPVSSDDFDPNAKEICIMSTDYVGPVLNVTTNSKMLTSTPKKSEEMNTSSEWQPVSYQNNIDLQKSEIVPPGSVPAVLTSTVNSKISSSPSKHSEGMNTTSEWQPVSNQNDTDSYKSEILPFDYVVAVLNSTGNSNLSISVSEQSEEINSSNEWQPVLSLDDLDPIAEEVGILSTDCVEGEAVINATTNSKNSTSLLKQSKGIKPTSECQQILSHDDFNPSAKDADVENKSKKGSKRRYDRKNYCIFCCTLVLQIRRHFLNNHKNETEIAQYLALFEMNAKESQCRRKKILSDLTAKGNHMYNKSVLNNPASNSDSSILLPVKRPPVNKKKTCDEYVFCTLCDGLFVKSSFRLHVAVCKVKDDDETNSSLDNPDTQEEPNSINLSTLDQKQLSMRRNNYVKEYGIPIFSNPQETSKKVKELIIPILRKDDVGISGMRDPLIMSIASDFFSSHQADKDKTQVTRKIRDAAKLLMKVREKNPEIKALEDLFNANYLETVLEACQSLCNLNSEQNSKVIVGMNARLSWVLEEGSKRLIDNIVCRSDITNEEKKEKKTRVKDFQQCLRRRWKYFISTNSEVSRRRLKMSKDFILPLDQDIKTFAEMLRSMEIEFEEKLKTDVTLYHYEMLCKVVICHILTLNRRRPFEATHAEIEFYLKRQSNNDYYSAELLKTFAEEEQMALNELSSFVVPAKGTESVATILMTKQMEKCIDVIISNRKVLKIEDSIYLFARPGLKTPFDGSKVLREMKMLCPGLIKPTHLTATGLRHHVATLAHVKGPVFSSKVSNFMTHTMAVHEKNYVAPVTMVHRGIIGNYMADLEGTELTTDKNNNSVENDLFTNKPSTSLPDPPIIGHHHVIDEPDDPTYEPTHEESDTDNEEKYRKICKKRNMMPPQKQKWTEEQKEVLIVHFQEFIKTHKNPGIIRCREFLLEFGSLFPGRNPIALNVYIDNINRKKIKIPPQLKCLFE